MLAKCEADVEFCAIMGVGVEYPKLGIARLPLDRIVIEHAPQDPVILHSIRCLITRHLLRWFPHPRMVPLYQFIDHI